MDEYVKVFVNEDVVDVVLYVEDPKVLAIGDKMNEVNEDAYMNGYNWEAFFNYYLEQMRPNCWRIWTAIRRRACMRPIIRCRRRMKRRAKNSES